MGSRFVPRGGFGCAGDYRGMGGVAAAGDAGLLEEPEGGGAEKRGGEEDEGGAEHGKVAKAFYQRLIASFTSPRKTFVSKK